MVGRPSAPYIAVESASRDVLAHFSPYAYRSLCIKYKPSLLIAYGDKNVVQFIYRWMLAGGNDSDKPKAMKFNNLHLPDLISLYQHCVVLEYEDLAERAAWRMKEKLKTVIPTVKQMDVVMKHYPGFVEDFVWSIINIPEFVWVP